jgi:hypothetical protein
VLRARGGASWSYGETERTTSLARATRVAAPEECGPSCDDLTGQVLLDVEIDKTR